MAGSAGGDGAEAVIDKRGATAPASELPCDTK